MASSTPIDPAQLERLKPELFALTRQAVKANGMPYASLLVDRATGTVIAKDYNTTFETFDPSNQCTVASLRKAQQALETADLSHTYIFSFFEPTLLIFDIALFAKITHFAWCIDAAKAPGHYVITEYTVENYASDHPNELQLAPGFAQAEANALLQSLPVHIPQGFRLGPPPSKPA
jgi:tRNA(Arg) A34 adenosine deaminase TadA